MALIYDFVFTAADYSGCSATIRGANGAEVDGSPVEMDASGRFSLSLPEGIYDAETDNTNLGLSNAHADGVLNLAASIAADGGGGASFETAHFIATGSGLTDATLRPIETLIADPAYTLPGWASVDGLSIAISESMSYIGSSVATFTAEFPTDVPSDPDGYSAFFCESYHASSPGAVVWGTDYSLAGESPATLDTVTGPFNSEVRFMNAGNSFVFKTNGDGLAGDGETPIPDGTYEFTAIYIVITRFVPAASIPA